MTITVRSALLVAFFPALILPPAQPLAAQDTDIHILCSNGIKAAVEKLLPEYERTTGRHMAVRYGASAGFKTAIEGGEPFDLVIVTSPIIAELTKEGKVAPGTAVEIATTGVGIAVRAGAPKPDVSTPDGIKKTLLNAKSIGYVKNGAGTAAILNLINHLGISDQVASKTALQSGADESMANVAAGHVDLAFALISEIRPVPGVQMAGVFPPEFQISIVMTAGTSSSTKNRPIVDQIVKSLTSAAAAPTIKASGLDPIGIEK